MIVLMSYVCTAYIHAHMDVAQLGAYSLLHTKSSTSAVYNLGITPAVFQ